MASLVCLRTQNLETRFLRIFLVARRKTPRNRVSRLPRASSIVLTFAKNMTQNLNENLIVAFRYEDSAIAAVPTSILAEKRSSYQTEKKLSDVQEPITSAPPEVRQIIERVLEVEKDKLYMRVPRHINDDILKIIKEAIV